jgi:hypothetical protein
MEYRARRPRQHAVQSCGRGEERPGQRAPCYFGRRAGLRISEDQRSWPRQVSHADPEPPTGRLVTTTLGRVVAGRLVRFSGASLIITRGRARNSRPGPLDRDGPQVKLAGAGPKITLAKSRSSSR